MKVLIMATPTSLDCAQNWTDYSSGSYVQNSGQDCSWPMMKIEIEAIVEMSATDWLSGAVYYPGFTLIKSRQYFRCCGCNIPQQARNI